MLNAMKRAIPNVIASLALVALFVSALFLLKGLIIVGIILGAIAIIKLETAYSGKAKAGYSA